MENFILNNENVGTTPLPKLISIIEAKNWIGISFCLKINDSYFIANKKRLNKNGSISLRCKFFKNCIWTGKIFNISEYGPDSKEYFNPENWVVTPNLNAAVHSCSGSCLDEISQLQMRQFTKEKFKEGISDFKTIVGLSGVKTSFADYGAKMLGDVDRFQRVIQRKRKIGVIGEVGHYPEECKKN